MVAVTPVEETQKGAGEAEKGMQNGSAGAGSKRYNFHVPKHLTISDMLTIQLADCVRIVQTLSDYASDPMLQDVERMHTIHSLENVVKASEILTRTMSRIGSDSWGEEPPRKPKR